MMLRDGEIITFFESPAFAEMLVIVGTDDIASFKNNNAWLAVHPANLPESGL